MSTQPTAKWVTFAGPLPSESGKTLIWEVRQRDPKAPDREMREVPALGHVGWYGRWRRYAFQPEPNTVYEPTCLRDIAAFCDWATAEHKAKGKPA